jgi:hypothetical protein
MSSSNGILSPPSTRHFARKSSPVHGKRKRAEGHNPPQANGTSTHEAHSHSKVEGLEDFQTDLLVVAQRYRDSSSTLEAVG